MVCKEEVLSWFKDLDSYRRIDVLYELLNMCVPFELRFIGTCVEEIGKHSYQELRGPTITANDLDKLSKDVSLTMGAGALLDECVRHRVLLYVALLSSRNYNVANWMYRTLLRTDYVDEFVRDKVLNGGSGRDELQNEFLLLYTMSLYHPAFTFEQKQEFARFLEPLIECRDACERTNNSRHINHFPTNNNSATSSSSSGSCNSYPPGLGFPAKKQMTEIPTIPVKTAPTLSYNDSVHQHPANLPPMSGQPIEIFWWNRAGIPFTPVTDVTQFPPAPQISPLVSQAESPSHSRSGSPHRTSAPAASMQIRPSPVLPTQSPLDGTTTIQTVPPPPPPVGVQPPSQPPLIDPLSQSSLPPIYNHEIKLEDELSSLQEEKQLLWPAANLIGASDVKHHYTAHHRHHPPTQNGYRYATFKMPPHPFIIEQMHAMSLDGENSLHQSATSSGSSSPCQTPPGTPCGTTTTNSATPHGPGRGGNTEKRVNGIGGVFPAVSSAGGAPSAASVGNMCDTTSPPPFTVPYSFPQTFTSLPPPPMPTAVAGRSIFPAFATPAAPGAPNGPTGAAPNYRSPFSAPYTYQTDTNSFTTFSYFPIMYSSPFPPPPPPRAAQQPPPTCYNCGAPGHLGDNCLAQNIEDITQKKAYQLDYSPPAATVAPAATVTDDK